MRLDPRSLGRAVDRLRRDGVEAVAVCYLHAYRDGRHEAATAEALARALPGVYVSLSSLVLPQIKEYERVWTTVVNAYVGPALARYLASLTARLRAHGYRGDVLIMQSHGGVAPVRESARLAAGAVLSGPAVQRVMDSPLNRLVVTDTIPLSPEARACPKIVQLPVSNLMAQAILRTHHEDSISSLFEIHF